MVRKRRINLNAKMRPIKGAPSNWDIAPIVHSKDLAAWLGITERQMYWLADLGCQAKSQAKSNHYACRWIRKRTGIRLIESPKPLLKKIQRQILYELLDSIPVFSGAHGFVKNRNVATYVADHVRQAVCIKSDLKSFFPSIRAGRVYRLFYRLGYPQEVARVLTGLCTTATRREVFADLREFSSSGQPLKLMYSQRHLPQGAPSSPALSNFCAFKLDCRLAGYATAMNGQYSRYADDLLFSFDSEFKKDRQVRNRIRRFIHNLGITALEEGFELNYRKTRIMFDSQRQMSAGIVFNQRSNLPRAKYDRLKAILFNCVVSGPESQNRLQIGNFRSHLAGQIAWARQLNPNKARKLVELFEKIQWPFDNQPV